VRASLQAGGGVASGTLPVHRWWNLGGWQTVRGHVAGSRRGDAYWLTRGELLWARRGLVQPVVFADAGWSGPREALARTGASPLGGAGAGLAFFGLPLRLDAARPVGQAGPWRTDVYAVLRF
jgi:hemolysin activation/secretion protein